ncbi:MAG: FeoA family protein [Chitinivibrionales bacterium]
MLNHPGKKAKTTDVKTGAKAAKSVAPAQTIMLTQLDNGASARVMELRGGHHMMGKLEAMGIVPGSTIIKKGSSIMKGPIVLRKGATQLAIGYATAQRIMVEPDRW